jgi:methylmalonyl-CoA/ethylmalonyl-CoA epimerase
MFAAIYHTGYLTDDLAGAIDLLKRTFGGTVTAETRSGDGGRLAYVQVGGAEVEVIEPADKSRLGGNRGLVLDHVGYSVEDLDLAIADLSEKGIRFQTAEPTVNAVGQRMIYLDAATTGGSKMHLTEVGRPV